MFFTLLEHDGSEESLLIVLLCHGQFVCGQIVIHLVVALFGCIVEGNREAKVLDAEGGHDRDYVIYIIPR